MIPKSIFNELIVQAAVKSDKKTAMLACIAVFAGRVLCRMLHPLQNHLFELIGKAVEIFRISADAND